MKKKRSFALIPPLDTYPRIVSFGSTALGKTVLLAVFALGLNLHEYPHGGKVILALTFITFFYRYRRVAITAAALGWIWISDGRYSGLARDMFTEIGQADRYTFSFRIAAVLCVLSFCTVYFYLSKRYGSSLLFKRPFRNVIVAYVILLLAAGSIEVTTFFHCAVMTVLILFGAYIWYFGYSLLDRGAKNTPPFWTHLGYFAPFWSPVSNIPIPKGSGNLRSVECTAPTELAITQLKGIKLLYWAYMLRVFHGFFSTFFYGETNRAIPFLRSPVRLDLPHFTDALHYISVGQPYSRLVNWTILGADFFDELIAIAVMGHVAIAICRMAGFRALRSTYKPLSAQSSLDFFNRYFYYFKELLVHFFFYPTFLRYFKRHRTLRLCFATFAAAGFGNLLYHYLSGVQFILAYGPWNALRSYQPYMVYCAALTALLIASQLKRQARKIEKTPVLFWRIVTPARILFVFCLLHIFNYPGSKTNLVDHFKFLFHLFGVRLG